MSWSPKERAYDRDKAREAAYLDWRWGLGDGLYCFNIDMVECEYIDNVPVAVGLTELTQCDTVLEAPGLLDKTWARLDPDGEGRSHTSTRGQRDLARKLDIPAFAVVHQVNGDRFAVRSLKHPDRWHLLDEARYKRLLHRMRSREVLP
jgi:hypothetical protein